MITFEDVKENEEVKTYLQTADDNFIAVGYKEHGSRHAITSAVVSGYILNSLGYPEKDVELAKIAAYLHDIGNALGQTDHNLTASILAMKFLRKIDMPPKDIFRVMVAIGSHEDRNEDPPNEICAAVILGDKRDVHRMRVRKTDKKWFDLHDTVNYAVSETGIKVDAKNKIIAIHVNIDVKLCSVMEYFEIFISRMQFCRRASAYFGCEFELYINGDKML